MTVIIDLTQTSTARLLGTVEGHSKAVFEQWLTARPDAWREEIEVVATDGFSGFKTERMITAYRESDKKLGTPP